MENIKEYWYLWLILAVLVILLPIVINKASKAVKKKYGILNSQDKILSRYKYLVENYSDLTKEKIISSAADELSEGIAATIQYSLEKSANFNLEFDTFPLWKKEIYAYDVFTDTVKDKQLSDFFRENGEPLFSLCFSLFEKTEEKAVLKIMHKMFPMLDSNNETVSVDEKLINQLNEEFSSIYNKDILNNKIKGYIIKNFDNN